MFSRSDVAEVMNRVFKELSTLREQGQKEYAHDEDNAFRNFESIGDRLDLPREKVLLTYLFKHLDGITAWVNGHKSQREGVEGRINDAIVYLILLRAMVEDIRKPPKQFTMKEFDAIVEEQNQQTTSICPCGFLLIYPAIKEGTYKGFYRCRRDHIIDPVTFEIVWNNYD